VSDPRALQRVEDEVEWVLAHSDSLVDAYNATLATIGESLGWELGAVWEVDAKDGRLRCAHIWRAGRGAEEFETLSAVIGFESGEGLPGTVLATGRPVWMVDAPADANFPRTEEARRAGLHAAFAFPLRGSTGVVGVIEFFARELRQRDEPLLAATDILGSHIGRFIAGLRDAG
jgi:signal transduction protein with GAF and PtsI domain